MNSQRVERNQTVDWVFKKKIYIKIYKEFRFLFERLFSLLTCTLELRVKYSVFFVIFKINKIKFRKILYNKKYTFFQLVF